MKKCFLYRNRLIDSFLEDLRTDDNFVFMCLTYNWSVNDVIFFQRIGFLLPKTKLFMWRIYQYTYLVLELYALDITINHCFEY